MSSVVYCSERGPWATSRDAIVEQETSSTGIAEVGDRGHNRHGPKKRGAAMQLSRELGPRLVHYGPSSGLLPYQAAFSSIQLFGHNRHGPKLGGGECALFSGGSWVHIENNVA